MSLQEAKLNSSGLYQRGTTGSEFWRPGAREQGGIALGGKALIVDDEADVCVYVALALKRLGIETAARTNPLEGLDVLLDDPTTYRLLITDQRMPGLSGTELIKRLWAKHPDFPVVLMSGYSWGIDPSELGVGFLSKPFELADLSRAIRQALHIET